MSWPTLTVAGYALISDVMYAELTIVTVFESIGPTFSAFLRARSRSRHSRRPFDVSRLLDDEQRIDWLRLSRTEGIGPVTFHRLLARYANATEALAA